jgi:hypothetical protein
VAPSLLLFILLMAMPVVLQRVARAGEQRVRERRWLSLTEELDDEPRSGWKTAQILLAPDGSSATLWGITVGRAYRVEDRARCEVRGCEPPALDCDCGFYAYKHRADALDLLRYTLACNGLRDKALLAVELDGTVLEYERGYRAERQQVMGVQVERVCGSCRDRGVGRRATGLAASYDYRMPALARLTGTGSAAASGLLPVRAVCDAHAPDRGHVFGIAELAGLLGTEVTWLP